jgi:hypothetical protein
MFSVTVFTALHGSGFQRWTFPSSGFPTCPRPHLPDSLLSQLQLSSDCLQNLCRLNCNGSWSTLHKPRTGRTRNAASTSFSVVLCFCAAATTWRILSHCIATAVYKQPLTSNGCLCWFQNSGFQQICHNTFSRHPTYFGIILSSLGCLIK